MGDDYKDVLDFSESHAGHHASYMSTSPVYRKSMQGVSFCIPRASIHTSVHGHCKTFIVLEESPHNWKHPFTFCIVAGLWSCIATTLLAADIY